MLRQQGSEWRRHVFCQSQRHCTPPHPTQDHGFTFKGGEGRGGVACRREKVKPLHLIQSRLITMDCLKW